MPAHMNDMCVSMCFMSVCGHLSLAFWSHFVQRLYKKPKHLKVSSSMLFAFCHFVVLGPIESQIRTIVLVSHRLRIKCKQSETLAHVSRRDLNNVTQTKSQGFHINSKLFKTCVFSCDPFREKRVCVRD